MGDLEPAGLAAVGGAVARPDGVADEGAAGGAEGLFRGGGEAADEGEAGVGAAVVGLWFCEEGGEGGAEAGEGVHVDCAFAGCVGWGW